MSTLDNGLWIPGYGDLTQAVVAELHKGLAARPFIMERQMRRAAAAGRERFHIADKEGGGPMTMMIHKYSYHYWGQRLGYECWKDKKFCREYLRDNPASRVKSRSRQPRIGWRAPQGMILARPTVNNKRSTTNYG